MNHIEDLRAIYGLTLYKAEVVGNILEPSESLITDMTFAELDWLKDMAKASGCQLAAVTRSDGGRIRVYLDDGRAIYGHEYLYDTNHPIAAMRRSQISQSFFHEMIDSVGGISFSTEAPRGN